MFLVTSLPMEEPHAWHRAYSIHAYRSQDMKQQICHIRCEARSKSIPRRKKIGRIGEDWKNPRTEKNYPVLLLRLISFLFFFFFLSFGNRVTMQTRLALNSDRFSCLCLLSPDVKVTAPCPLSLLKNIFNEYWSLT